MGSCWRDAQTSRYTDAKGEGKEGMTGDIVDKMIKSKKRDIWALVISLILQVIGYAMLLIIDWRIAVAIFAIHSAINIERNVMKREILWSIFLSGKDK